MDMIKELRNATGVSITECKKALEEANGDIDAAIEELRKKGIAKAGKRSENETSEGRIKIATKDGKAYIVSVTCETDFVSRNDNFEKNVGEALDILMASGDAASARTAIEAKITDWILQLGENMRLGLCEIIDGGAIGAYVHSNHKVAAVVTAKAGTDEDKLKQVAMHVTATDANALYEADFPAEVIAKEKEIQLEMMKNDPKMEGKPDQVLEKIIDGKMDKFVSEQTLTSQGFIINPDQTVGDFIGADALTGFRKFTI